MPSENQLEDYVVKRIGFKKVRGIIMQAKNENSLTSLRGLEIPKISPVD